MISIVLHWHTEVFTIQVYWQKSKWKMKWFGMCGTCLEFPDIAMGENYASGPHLEFSNFEGEITANHIKGLTVLCKLCTQTACWNMSVSHVDNSNGKGERLFWRPLSGCSVWVLKPSHVAVVQYLLASMNTFGISSECSFLAEKHCNCERGWYCTWVLDEHFTQRWDM